VAARAPASGGEAQRAGERIVVMAEIVAAYGVRGWVKVRPYTAQSPALLGYRTWMLQRRDGANWLPTELREGREHSGALIVRLAAADMREAAIALVGARVGVPRSALPEAGSGELYREDLVGLEAFNRAGVRLGRVGAVEDFGAHPVLRVEREGGAQLIPFVPALVDAVDVAGGRIDVDWEPDY
jgi:16S rRNA processing protein RimM